MSRRLSQSARWHNSLTRSKEPESTCQTSTSPCLPEDTWMSTFAASPSQNIDIPRDEYAGLGGADGEDSGDGDEELVKEMIDDAAGNDNDEGKLAGLFADYLSCVQACK
ncbi:Uu.00g093910.m01.CDS01 [Anthostomella pinea]|uniref:Uu.00g093910.m01.CDS01 n=1 Tax=Anthostomella pinea TaxID=933095 RepID=A0AAI8YKL1_9PEZI|nr:Uu.00g093910.m01.CDS01 [Anthostomella pinea]